MRLLKRPEVQLKTGKGRSSIYNDMARGLFPKPVNIGPKAVGWIEEEINQWIRDRIAERDQGA
jgi:prophage regulatory protein